MYLALWLISRWRLPATPCLTLPVAVILKRFFTPLLVFSLGIFVSCRQGHVQPALAALLARPADESRVSEARASRAKCPERQGGRWRGKSGSSASSPMKRC